MVERSLCMWKARGSIPRISTIFSLVHNTSSCGRVVKALDLKSNGLCPRRFEPCQLRQPFSEERQLLIRQLNSWQNKFPSPFFSSSFISGAPFFPIVQLGRKAHLFFPSFAHFRVPCDETKILTDTETLYPRQIFPIPIPRLFYRDQIFRDRYRDFFSETKFSDTNTETFFSRPNFSIPRPRLSKNCHGSRDWDRDRDFWIWLMTLRYVYRRILATFGNFFITTFF